MTSQFRKWVLSSPPAEWALGQVRDLLIGSVKQGPVPKHVAFVMDGNRRYAKNNRLMVTEGHNLGFEALARILEVCFKAGVKVVSIYAFSIENFKRSKYEVDGLMDMAKIKLTQLAQHGELLERYGARIRVLGQRELVKKDVLEAIDRAVDMTAGNGDCILNICFPYTSREEITTAIRSTVEDYTQPLSQQLHDRRTSAFKEERIASTIRSQQLSDDTPTPSQTYLSIPRNKTLSTSSSSTSLSSTNTPETTVEAETSPEQEHETASISSATTLHIDSPPFQPHTKPGGPAQPDSSTDAPSQPVYASPESITPATLDSHMYTAGDPPLDLLIRTSGVERLSDFMLWQCHQDTHIVFLKVLWPEFDLWSFLPVMWEWQWRVRKEEVLRKERERDTIVKVAKGSRRAVKTD